MGGSLIIHVFDGRMLISKYGREGRLIEEFEAGDRHFAVDDMGRVRINRYVFLEGVMMVIDIGEE